MQDRRERNKNLSEEEKENKVEYMTDYYLTHKKISCKLIGGFLRS